jgi:2-(1,2-epoxy-1,2-dihydrophenyl)acetyl-CoA isomerase
MTMEMKREMVSAVKEAESDNTCRAVVITGAGKAFCAGADLGAFSALTPAVLLSDLNVSKELILLLVNMPKPVIAAVQGAAVGVGFSIALASDVIIASNKARFGGVWVGRGLHPDGGATYLLPRRVGYSRASELLLSGRFIEAEEAARIGLVNRVVEPEELETAVASYIEMFARSAPLAIGMTKASLNQAPSMDLATMLEFEMRAQSMLAFTEDSKEAIAAFLEKRTPVYRWR